MRIIKALLCVFLLTLTFSSSAHQLKESLTRIVFNERTSNIEIMHRFSVHDVEHASKKLFGVNFDILSNSFSQKHFADYVSKKFSMKNLNGSEMKLTDVGFEIENYFIWVYQETELVSGLEGLKINNGALREVWSDQTNLVNIERDKKVRSLVFKGTDGEKEIPFSD